MGDAQIRSFGGLLQHLEDGQLLTDLGQKLDELNAKLVKQAATGGAAKAELRLTIKMKADMHGVVDVDSVIDVKEPRPLRMRSLLWLTPDGRLISENPKQVKLPLREVPSPQNAAEPRSV